MTGIRGKREFAARVSETAGFTRVVEALGRRPILMVINYHRIGNAAETPFDPNIFSATAEEFGRQIAFLKRRFHVATLPEVVELVERGRLSGPAVLITFDDGYIDNYRIAFPILRAHGVQGVFFLATAFVGSGRLPWWDVIAYIVKKSRKPQIRLAYPARVEFDVAAEGAARATARILHLFKQSRVASAERFIEELETACDTARPPASGAERCFLNWEEAREMQAGGMAFGSHTHLHEILAKLPVSEQERELSESRRALEQNLGRPVETIAYPFGLRNSFSAETKRAAEKSGYRAGFSFYGGSNTPGRMDPFDIRRYGVDGQSYPRLRLQTALVAAGGSRWF